MLRPFLLIGVGGSGGKTLRVIRDDLQRRLQQAGWKEELPRAWQFLHIDVPTIADGDDQDLPGQLPDRDYKGLVASGVDYLTIDTAMTSSSGAHLTDALGGWRPDPNRVAIPAAKGAGQFRALGRVITLASLDRVRDALQSARRDLTGAEVVGELQRATQALGGKPATNPHAPTVIVVSSIAGGSGSGAVIDVCDAVRALGDTWANEIVGLLYAPDVFDHLKEEARKGVRPNSLAALSELLSGYWNEEGATEGTTELFARYGVQLGAARRLGPRYPFLVGSRNDNVTYETQNDIYRAMGRSLASWVASPILADRMSAYLQTNWSSAAAAVPDRLPLHIQGAETPFVALGSSRVGLGRDRFRDYAAEHMARTVAERFLHRHETLRSRGDDRTEKQLVRDVADSVFGGFLGSSGLDERGEDRNQIVDALRPATLKDDLRAEYQSVLTTIREGIPDKGHRAPDVRRQIRNTVVDRRRQFQTDQLAKRTATARDWVIRIQQDLTALVASTIAAQGGPVALELLRRLATELRQVREELTSEATTHKRWAADLEQHIRGALNDPDTAVILRTTDRLDEAVRRAIQTFASEQEAEVRDMAADLIPDLASNVIEPMIEALGYAIDALSNERGVGRIGQTSVMSQWPIGDSIPERLKPAANEFLLEPVEAYPAILADVVRRTIDAQASAGDARHQADIEILMGAQLAESAAQQLVARDTVWVPKNHLMHESVTAAPARSTFRVVAGAADLLDRAREWLLRPGTAAGRYMAEGLRDYLDAEAVGPKEAGERLQRFEGQLIAALNAGAPLVSVNPAVLVQVHERRSVAYFTSFSEIPLPDRSAARQRFRQVLEARGQWGAEVASAFSDNNGAFIDIFTAFSEPYEPVVFDSLMRPIASEWGARSKSSDQRAEFWRWRRARPLPEALPFSPAVRHAMVRGWFVAGCLGHIQLSADTGVKIFVPAVRGAGGDAAAFPWPTLTPEGVDSPNLMPALLESVALAMLQVNTLESLAPMRPYERLRELGDGASEELSPELKQWVLDGVNRNGQSDLSGSWETRRTAVETKLEKITANFSQYFDRIALRTDLLGYPGAYELRHDIKSALGDLRRAVSELQPASEDGVFV